ncbi:TRAP transporter small permease [Paenibacillus validus]|uniref:TRAP transporter small permease subunit n=1 Tax=Paenibacillus validus TaxID=44253 RepID=A0A7X3CSN9_9BACL|nr:MULTISPECIES: TRAP transporter small permease [Paenibacillus]MED4599423.1 TRAP transporter small permease [Paenibacillus validus]MED4605135.1 TRAP transporter small permease [Paenibacillus validus]MUG72010.1 TRAP transporter small permease subunit [Paenibacillus validus]
MKWLRHWLEIIAGSCLAVVVVVTFLQVLFRFVLKIPTPWTEEVTRFAFAYMAFIGAVLGTKYHSHLNVDVINQLPPKIRTAVTAVGYMVTIAFVAFFTYYGWVHTMNSKLQTTPTLQVSLMYMYIIMPISGVLMLYYLVKAFAQEVRGKRQGGEVA